mmetsp:Transcript_17477/g.32176  ORF Transcript_17477/g.32176 Transcript_17477/m.32176 type:complete len:238 (+) Transcript_17477:636-1349(+)
MTLCRLKVGDAAICHQFCSRSAGSWSVELLGAVKPLLQLPAVQSQRMQRLPATRATLVEVMLEYLVVPTLMAMEVAPKGLTQRRKKARAERLQRHTPEADAPELAERGGHGVLAAMQMPMRWGRLLPLWSLMWSLSQRWKQRMHLAQLVRMARSPRNPLPVLLLLVTAASRGAPVDARAGEELRSLSKARKAALRPPRRMCRRAPVLVQAATTGQRAASNELLKKHSSSSGMATSGI